MKTTTSAVVKMAKGSNWIRLEISSEQGSMVHLSNSKGELAWILRDDAQARIASLVAAGWKATTVTR
jgi:hypothetical protein